MLKAIRQLLGGRGSGAGGAGAGAGEPVAYKGFTIVPVPRKQGSQYLAAGVIRKEGPDGEREAQFIRSDTFGTTDGANECAVRKARQIIDEQGEALFDKDWP